MEKHIDLSLWFVWCDALAAIYKANRGRWVYNAGGGSDWFTGDHLWHIQVREKFSLHPLIERIIRIDAIRPVDWQQLLLEWPHVSEDDEVQIAYTRSDAAGSDFYLNGSQRQTRTSIGKYLSRHWPHVPDHIRRDWAGRIQPAKFEIWDTIEGIISGVELGPQSCMKSSYMTIPFRGNDNVQLCAWQSDKSVFVDWDRHPYIVYQPEYGWKMAVRIDPGKPDIVMGRCLINIDPHSDSKIFVRSYTRNENEGGTSYSDEKLESWLRDQGFYKASGWDGCRIARRDHPDSGLMLPYLDGSPQKARDEGRYLVISSRGTLDGTNTDGSGGSDAGDYVGDCVRCDDSVYDGDDERISVGRNDDEVACGSCSVHFTLVRGASSGSYARRAGYREYYLPDDEAISVRGTNYDPDHLPDCIKVLHDDEYAHEDDCVWVEGEEAYYLIDECVECQSDDNWYVKYDDEIVEIDGDCYRKDDDDVVVCKDDKYRLKDDCWQDDETQHWYHEDVDAIEIDYKMYHPDTLKQWLIDAGQMSLDLEY
ncbi:hypothetical protein UFOVP228_45 [uncultured Caudovirales phage]|uniref:Uncharacterized protein n=1 Tax=uncultured Caudovirales phage TaxID=2100421 RepID=A0A6J7WQY9_9CAUD|nr:hypothetical protein UFOVP47_57 [uncultured Caudovirales phage]CAB5219248.1 hypothetical protein UFOVP228_45 [uncultured Caudovirales phage]